MQFARSTQETEAPPLSPIMENVARLRAAGRDPIVLAQAMVDAPPPDVFTRSLAEALARGDGELHHYAPDPGLPELRAVLADYLARAFSITADPEREILITPGANHAAYIALAAILDPGDEVICISPWYFNHVMSVRLLGARLRSVATSPADDFVPQIDEILAALTARTKAIILVNPNNPSGACYPDEWVREFARAISEAPQAREVWLLCDQTYQEIFYESGRPASLASVPALRGRVATVGSFSKCFALAGWRVGFLAGPSDLIAEALKVQDSTVICAPRPAQWAIARTLEQVTAVTGYFARLRQLLQMRRDALVDGLAGEPRLSVMRPGGSCFVMLRLPADVAAAAFADALMQDDAVATVPGPHFGLDWSTALRLSFGTELPARLAEAGARIKSRLRGW